MYGLMRPRACSHDPQAAHRRRLHYCGTCKTMGRLYGQRSRLLLNNDAVFLAELLTALSPDSPALETWTRAYQSYNCLALPETEMEMPLALQVAATATLVMSEFKVADQIADAAHGGWRMVGRLYSEGFAQASARMQAWGFPVLEIRDWYQAQQARETAIRANPGARSPSETLEYTAEPTAVVTGLVFQHGARLVGASEEAQATMYALGHGFGTLVYVLDAYEDFARDERKGDFNALQAAFGTAGESEGWRARQAAIASLQEVAGQIRRALRQLPLAPALASLLVARLDANLAHKLGLPAAQCCRHAGPVGGASVKATPRGFRARWQDARSLAGTLAGPQRTPSAGKPALPSPFAFAIVFLIALVFPRQALAATSYQECRDVAFNLMVWGAMLSALLTAPQRLFPAYRMAQAGGGPEGESQSGGMTHSSSQKHSVQVVKTQRVRRRYGCCCDGCDCGDEGDCCCCCCQGLDCAAGCGDCGACDCGSCDCCSSCS